MKKLTLTVTEETYRTARVWATQCNLSISALVRNYLEILSALPCPGVDAENETRAVAALPLSPRDDQYLHGDDVEAREVAA